MITKHVVTAVAVLEAKTMVELGNGDIQISETVVPSGDGKGHVAIIGFGKLPGQHEVGEDVTDVKGEEPEVYISFLNEASINALQAALNRARKDLKAAEEQDVPEFVVKFENVIIPASFTKSKPDPEKLMSCMESYTKGDGFGKKSYVLRTLCFLMVTSHIWSQNILITKPLP